MVVRLSLCLALVLDALACSPAESPPSSFVPPYPGKPGTWGAPSVYPPPTSSTSSTSSTSPTLATEAAPPPEPSAPKPTAPAPSKAPTPAACGIGPGEAIAAPETWSGESDACRALDMLWAGVSHTERACSSDAECAIVVGTCNSDSVTKKALSKYRTPTCEQPTPRTCSKPSSRATCVAGCCRPATS